MPILKLPRLGATFPDQGGIFGGLIRGENGGADYALIVPTSFLSMFKDIPWGEYGKAVKGCDHLRDGLANTVAMAEAGNPLARNIMELDIEGHKDFYLPARHELRALFLNVPELFETNDWYWSSTQSSPGSAWVQYVSGGGQYYGDKSYEFSARAVRRLII